MSTADRGPLAIRPEDFPFADSINVGIAVSKWNPNVTEGLLNGALAVLKQCGISADRIELMRTPGSFELPLAAQWLCEKNEIQGAIVLGSVIQGETRHFDFVCQGVTQGTMDVSLKTGKPVVFGVLTDNTMEQALARSGGAMGNKGEECALALLEMIALQQGG